MTDQPPGAHSPGEVTVLLDLWRSGDSDAMEELMPIVYKELRRMAGAYMRKERDGHTMMATELVHEAYIRLTGDSRLQLANRGHFLALLASTMRRILIEHARRQSADKRIGHADKIALDEAPQLGIDSDLDVVEIHEALETLSQIHPRQARLVELRFFGGLTSEEVADALGTSLATVTRDWRIARLWLHRHLTTS